MFELEEQARTGKTILTEIDIEIAHNLDFFYTDKCSVSVSFSVPSVKVYYWTMICYVEQLRLDNLSIDDLEVLFLFFFFF